MATTSWRDTPAQDRINTVESQQILSHRILQIFVHVVVIALLWPLPLAFAQQDPATDPATRDTETAAAESDNSTPAPSNSEDSSNANSNSDDNKPPKPVPVSRAPLQREQQQMQQLANRLGQEQAIWLETAEDRFLGLYLTDASGHPKGALLILHAEERDAHGQDQMAPVREWLPDYGWATLSISLPKANILIPEAIPTIPPIDTSPSPPSTETSDNGQSTADPTDESTGQPTEPETFNTGIDEAGEDHDADLPPGSEPTMEDPVPAPVVPPVDSEIVQPEPVDIRQLSNQRIHTALAYLNEQGQFNIVVVADGGGIERALNYLADPAPVNDGQRAPIQGLVMINRHDTDAQKPIDALSDYQDIAILDIFYGPAARQLDAAKQRQRWAKRQRLQKYRQMSLPPHREQYQAHYNRLAKHLRGWLKHNAEGQERVGLIQH